MAAVRGGLIDHSGSITTGGTAQALAPQNFGRHYFLFQNLSTGDLYVNFGANGNIGSGSIKVVAGDDLAFETQFIPTDSVSVIGATAGQAFTCKEG